MYYLLVYNEASGKKATSRVISNFYRLNQEENIVSIFMIRSDDKEIEIIDKHLTVLEDVEKIIIYGDVISEGIMRLVVAAFEKGIPISRCSFKWKLQPVCRGCIYRENDGERYVESTYSCCTYHLKHNEFRKAPPLGDWCPYKKKRKG